MSAPKAADVLAAAAILEALNTHQGNGTGMPWRADELRREAESLAAEAAEAEAAEAAKLEAQAEALAVDVFQTLGPAFGAAGRYWVTKDAYLATARALIEAGWRKDDA